MVTNSIRLTNVVINIVGTGSQVHSEIGSATGPISTNRTDYDEVGRVKSRTGPDSHTTSHACYPDGQFNSSLGVASIPGRRTTWGQL